MTHVIFKAEDVRRVVEHSLSAPGHREKVIDYDEKGEPVTEPGKPAIILVHDDGIYLMSNGIPRDPRDPAEPEGRSYVAYALGCHPDKDPDFWDNARDLVGGDDFAETLEIAEELKQIIDSGYKTVIIDVTADHIEIIADPKLDDQAAKLFTW